MSLGCPKNLVDSEVMMGVLSSKGHKIVSDPEEAEIIICNTCAFIEEAAQESVDQVLQLASHKEGGKCKLLVVAGCLSQRYGEKLLQEMPEVDGVIGTGEFHNVAEICERALRGERVVGVTEPHYLYDHLVPRHLSTPAHYAYLKIAEGCSNLCSYCIIPQLRGDYRSRGFDSIVEEAEILAGRGVKELVLIAQDTTKYGVDLYGRARIGELLRVLSKTEGIRWIRLLYTHPHSYTPELARVVAEEERICKYLDLPIQHICSSILKAMNRKVTRGEIEDLIGTLRRSIPDLVLRTSLIVGFPGEGEEEFQELLDFVALTKFERLGVFRYSREDGTPVARMDGQVPEGTKSERWDRVMEVQREISYQRNLSLVGKVVEVLVDERLPEDETEGGFLHRGRTCSDAPAVDCSVFLKGSDVEPGDFVRVKVLTVDDFDLFGEVVSSQGKAGGSRSPD